MASTINDERLVAVKTEEEKALNKSNTMYNSMIADSQKYYDQQIQASKDYAKEQSKLQQEQTDFAIEKIEQEKEQANKDYIREQSGSYVDWQKESNRYGANAETMAANGFVASGYGESSQVAMYNQYQNRVATARETYNKAVLNYNNAITEARLQNNSVLAEIAYNALQQQLELALQGMQYKNQLLETQANKQLEIKNMYNSKYQSVLDQINKENALAEEIRQYNQSLALQKAQLEEEKRQFNASLSEQQRQFNASMSARSSGGSGGSSGGGYTSSKASSGGSSTTYSKNGGAGSSGANSGKAKTNSAYSPIYYVGGGGQFGNSKSVQNKSNYYFSNGYQPRYIDNKKLTQAKDSSGKGITVADLDPSVAKGLGIPTSQKVWTAGGRAYVWVGSTKEYAYIGKV